MRRLCRAFLEMRRSLAAAIDDEYFFTCLKRRKMGVLLSTIFSLIIILHTFILFVFSFIPQQTVNLILRPFLCPGIKRLLFTSVCKAVFCTSILRACPK